MAASIPALAPDHIPVFERQPEFIAAGGTVTRIDNELLSGVTGGARFNGSIIEWKGRCLMAYRRYNPDRRMRSVPPEAQARGEKLGANVRDIALTVLDENWKPTAEHYSFALQYRHGDECYEDPRLFIHKGVLWMSCVYFLAVPGGCLCHQYLYALDDNFKIVHWLKINAGKNLGGPRDWEKNWTYFTAARPVSNPAYETLESSVQRHKDAERLILLYNVCEMQTHEINAKSGEVLDGWIDRKLYWPYGHMRGGTCPVRLPDGTFLKFVHNSTDHEWRIQGGTRRYSMSAVIFDSQPPFRILKVSKLPIAWGSRHEDFCGHGNSQCVFPAGTILEDNTWHVSLGVNDTYNAIFHLDAQKTMAGMVDVSEFHTPRPRYFFTTKPNRVACIIGREDPWRITRAGGSVNEAILSTQDPFTIAELLASDTASEITAEEYEKIWNRVKMSTSLPPNKTPKNPPAMSTESKTPTVSITPAAATSPVASEATSTPAASTPPPPVPNPSTGNYDLYSGIRHYIPAMVHGWSSADKCCRMAGDIVGLCADISVDLGAYGGRAAIAMGMAHRQSGRGICHAIDLWDNKACLEGMKDENSKKWWGGLDLNAIHDYFLQHIGLHNLQDYIKVHRLSVDKAAEMFQEGTVGVIHFDANHSEEPSLRDIRAWMPKLKPGGYLYFDDTDWREENVNTTAKAQQVLLDAGWLLTHTAPAIPNECGEWKCFQRPRGEPAQETSEQTGPEPVEEPKVVGDIELAEITPPSSCCATAEPECTETITKPMDYTGCFIFWRKRADVKSGALEFRRNLVIGQSGELLKLEMRYQTQNAEWLAISDIEIHHVESKPQSD